MASSNADQPDHRKTRTMRVTNAAWDAGRARAEREGTTITKVAEQFVEGYAAGAVDTPRTKTTVVFD